MKKLLLVVMAVFAIAVANAQTETKTTLVLKNGTEIRGVVLQEVPGEYITIKADSGDIFTYRMDEVQSGMNEKLNNQVQQQRALVAKREANKPYTGYRGIVEIGGAFSPGSGTADLDYRASVHFINGGYLTPHLYLGIGVGLAFSKGGYSMDDWGDEYYFVGKHDYVSVPLFANIRASFLKGRKVTPFVSLKIGYDIALKSKLDRSASWYDEYYEEYHTIHYSASFSGFYMEPTLGAQIARNSVSSKKQYWMVGITFITLPDSSSRFSEMYGVGLRAGLTF